MSKTYFPVLKYGDGFTDFSAILTISISLNGKTDNRKTTGSMAWFLGYALHHKIYSEYTTYLFFLRQLSVFVRL